MSLLLRRIFWLVLGLGLMPGFLAPLAAQDAVLSGALPAANAETAATPPLPAPKSPIDFFRQLLVMNAADRVRNLAGRPPENRKRILEKLSEYENLKPNDREIRLRMTELRWYLLEFMNTPPTNRPAQLAYVPEADRQMVNDRLAQWDLLPPELQKEVLANEKILAYFVGTSDTNAPAAGVPPQERADLMRLNQMPVERRQRMCALFQGFFHLTDAEKQETLSTLSEAERGQMETTLKVFESLPPDRRELCLSSFGRFANLSGPEQAQFLADAERWKEMSPADRQAWRDLVTRLPETPPFPLGFMPYPPGYVPPSGSPRPAQLPLATDKP